MSTATSELAVRARTIFTEAIEGEVGRRGTGRMVQRSEVAGHVVMQFLSEAVPNAAGMGEAELRQRLGNIAKEIVNKLVGGRTGDTMIVPQYWPPTFWMDHSHLQFDWHVGSYSAGEVQQRISFPKLK